MSNIQDTFDDKVRLPLMKASLGEESSSSFFSASDIDLSIYDNIIVCMSGGKDSLASLLHLFDLGADRRKIELWHHEIDGREGSSLMDWPFMPDFNREIARAFSLPLYFSWLEGGFEGEMLKNNSLSLPHHVETPEGEIILPRDEKRGRPGTRLKFPQVSANLQVRWCSSALKIDVGRRALNNQERFNGKKVLFITGERREESPNRARYNQFEHHACDRRKGRKNRLVDAWRPVLEWKEEQVWDALERYRVLPPVPYRLGWNRSSCMKCIFNDAAIWATLREYFPGELDAIANYEKKFGTTISRDKKDIISVSKQASPLKIFDEKALSQALKKNYALPFFCEEGEEWQIPAGAYAKTGCGPS